MRRRCRRRGSLRRLALVAGLSFLAAGFSASRADAAGEQALRVLDASTGSAKATFTVELARTFDEQVRGLQGRQSLEPDRGMLFLYSEAAPRSFWMKDVVFPIDLLFADKDGRVTQVLANLAPCVGPVESCPSYRSRSPARYALELAAGQAAAHRIGPGDRLEFDQ